MELNICEKKIKNEKKRFPNPFGCHPLPSFFCGLIFFHRIKNQTPSTLFNSIFFHSSLTLFLFFSSPPCRVHNLTIQKPSPSQLWLYPLTLLWETIGLSIRDCLEWNGCWWQVQMMSCCWTQVSVTNSLGKWMNWTHPAFSSRPLIFTQFPRTPPSMIPERGS